MYIGYIVFAKKLGALIAEELTTAGIIVTDLSDEKRQMLADTILIASEMICEKLQQLIDERSH